MTCRSIYREDGNQKMPSLKKASCASVTWQNQSISLGQGSFKLFGLFGLGIQRNFDKCSDVGDVGLLVHSARSCKLRHFRNCPQRNHIETCKLMILPLFTQKKQHPAFFHRSIFQMSIFQISVMYTPPKQTVCPLKRGLLLQK